MGGGGGVGEVGGGVGEVGGRGGRGGGREGGGGGGGEGEGRGKSVREGEAIGEASQMEYSKLYTRAWLAGVRSPSLAHILLTKLGLQ